MYDKLKPYLWQDKMVLIRLKYIILLCCVFRYMNADEPYSIHINKSNGLPSNSIYNLFQDSKGFIWFTSNNGLTRFDGFEYKHYTSEIQTSKAGSCISEDKFGRIWYENFDGNIYYVEHDSLKSLNQKTPIGYIPFGITDKHLFVIQNNGIDVYDLSTLKIIKTIVLPITIAEHSLSNKQRFYAIIDNTIYCVTENLSLIVCDYFKNLKPYTKQIYSYNNNVYVVYKHNEYKQVYLFNDKLQFKKTINIKEPSFIQGSNYTDSLIWVHSANGTYAYNAEETTGCLAFSFFNTKSVSFLLKDRQQNYWFSTTDNGIYIVPNLKNTVYYFDNFIANKIIETKNDYCLATKKGELIFCNKSFEIKSSISQKSDNSEIYFSTYDSISNKIFYSSSGFSEVDVSNKDKINFYPIAIKDMIRIDSNYFAFSATGYCGLAKFNSSFSKSPWDSTFQSNMVGHLNNTCHLLNNIRGKSVAYLKSNNTLYYATNVGLFKCTPYQTKEIRFNNESFYVNKLLTINTNLYALSTKGNLYQIKDDGSYVNLNNILSIKANDIKLIKSNQNKMVIITSKYAYLVDVEKNTHSLLDIDLKAYETSDVLVKDNQVLFVTSSGIISTTSSSKTINNDAIITINELRINNKLYNHKVNHLLNYLQNDVSIKYSILDFGNAHINSVFYRINESDWKLASPETRVIEFAALSSGNYVIEFKLNETVSTEKIIFTISTPFWKTIWFNILLSTLVLIIAFVYYKWQLTKLRTKNKLLQDKINLEHNLNKTVLKSIKAQMNPHFFYNALNTIQAFIFTNDKTKASSYLAKFSKLTRAILEMSEKETISLSEEIDALTLYLELEKMRFKDGFSYQLNITNIENTDLIEFPPMIIQPYVENAIKHGLLHLDGNRELSVSFNLSADSLLVVIDDNGIGRKRSAELNKIKNHKYQSFSSEANEKRLEILNKGRNNAIAVEIIDKTNDLGVATGTRVKLTIPIK